MALAAMRKNIKFHRGGNFPLNPCSDNQESILGVPDDILGQWWTFANFVIRAPREKKPSGVQRKAVK